MEPLQHDPRTKLQIKDALYAHIYDPVQRQFKSRLDTIIARNSIAGGYTHNHFVYKGVLYSAESTNPPLRRNRLLAALRDPMDEYLRDLAHLNTHELPYVLGFLNQVLNASNDMHDYLRVLPESLHSPLHALMATCPCRNSHLPDDRIQQMVEKNAGPIQLMKQRLVTNLLI